MFCGGSRKVGSGRGRAQHRAALALITTCSCRESNPGYRRERPRSWPLNDRNVMVLAGGVEPAVSRLRAWRRCRWTTRACGWEGRTRTAITGVTIRGPTVERPPNVVAPGRLERPSPDFRTGVLPVGRQGHGCCARARIAILGAKGLTGPQATPVACSGLRPDPVRPAIERRSKVVAGGGFEPPTSGSRDRRSATELTRMNWWDASDSNRLLRGHNPTCCP